MHLLGAIWLTNIAGSERSVNLQLHDNLLRRIYAKQEMIELEISISRVEPVEEGAEKNKSISNF